MTTTTKRPTRRKKTAKKVPRRKWAPEVDDPGLADASRKAARKEGVRLPRFVGDAIRAWLERAK